MYLLPHFYKTGSLVGYLYGPIFYFFIIATVNGDFKLRLRDLVHFIPFSLHFLELLPFFLLSGEEKRILYSKDPQTYFMDVDWGYFSQRIHTIFKCILIITYSFVGYRLILPFLNNILNSDTTQSRMFGLFLKWSIFSLFLAFQITIQSPKQINVNNSQYSVWAFELTTSWTWISLSLHHGGAIQWFFSNHLANCVTRWLD